MKKNKRHIWVALTLLILAMFMQVTVDSATANTKISGEIADGYRILTVKKETNLHLFTVFRGDYIKFDVDASMGTPVLTIPMLSVKETLPDDLEKAPYFKMKETGTYEFFLGEIEGRIMVIGYHQEHYRELTSQQAADFIKATQPLVLDVRSPYEFKSGHLKDARLIPVQQLQRRLEEISNFKDREILVYCATGNRSTVASKILNDNGFNRVSNLRHGIYQWTMKRFPIVR